MCYNAYNKGGESSVDIDTYKNFLAIIDAGTVTAAAERMHITQPSLS